MPFDVTRILVPTVVAFFIGIFSTPILTHYLYKHHMWKKSSVKLSADGLAAPITSKLHNDEDKKTPRMGGIIVWGSTLITAFIFWLLALLDSTEASKSLDFLSRNQTWLPLFTLVSGGLFGMIDDYLVTRESGSYKGGGLSLSARLVFVTLLGTIGACWFYFKLGMTDISIPIVGVLSIDWMIIPVFIVFFVGIYSGGIIDGVDGLSGGVFASIYAAYAVIAYANAQLDMAAFCAVVTGSLLAFLWFNIPPARFYNSETGTMALTTALVVVAFLTNAVSVLLVIALPLIVTSLSSTIQILSKKFRGGKKVFIVAPLHNHFQAAGWPPYKVTMRYWIISAILSTIGVIIHLAG